MSDTAGGRRSEVGDRFDAAIDRAVREMLDVEPGADFRARVIARLPAAGARLPAAGSRVPAFGFRRFAALAAAVALIVLGVLLARRAEAPAKPRVVAADQILPSPQPGPQDVAAVPTAPRSAPVRSTVAAASYVDPGGSEPGIEPLNSIGPIEVASIAPPSITPDPIGVRPLDPITEMQIAPLNPPDRRD
jgi:hypothetical protein